MLTADQKDKLDFLSRLENYDIGESLYKQHEGMLNKRFKMQPSHNDIAWSMLNELSSKSKYRPMVYIEMARIAQLEGKDSKPYIAEITKSELRELRSMGVKYVKVVGCGMRNDDPNTCDNCKSLFDKKLILNNELKKPQIPHVCSNEQCRCSYVGYEKIELEDKLNNEIRAILNE